MRDFVLQGIVKRHPDGFGFFIPDDSSHPDVYLARGQMTGIMTNDRVEIRAYPESGGERFRGEVRAVLRRSVSRVVGRVHVQGEGGWVRDESHGWGADLRIPPGLLAGAKEGELVAVEITSYGSERSVLAGRVIEVIGDSEDPLNDVRRVLYSQGIPTQFSPATEAQLRSFQPQVSETDKSGRKDLRGLKFVTIDGATARDFDDAICVESSESGYVLWVAIADVSHYVRPGTPLDQDAYERGTSVYFPNFVVPMLPEILSNELCSLKPQVDRLALVAQMQLSSTGEIERSVFFEAVICSRARITYGEAQEVIDGGQVPALQELRNDLVRAADLAKILLAKRMREGSLDLDVPESQIQIDEAGRIVDIVRSERLFAHRLIEELMLAANVAVAHFLTQSQTPAIYRIHEEPSAQALEQLEKFLFNFGGRVSLRGEQVQMKITKALKHFAGKPQAEILSTLTLRTMKQAKYSAENVGHFGLAFSHYTHFTSPIRRYPDLIVHRLLKATLRLAGYAKTSVADLQTAATMLSATELRAVKAERQFVAIKKARFMHDRLGEEFEGVVSSVAKFGLFVLLREFDVDGLIKTESLGHDERFFFDPENLKLIGQRSGVAYTIGDQLRVQVAASDIEAGQIEFILPGELARFQAKGGWAGSSKANSRSNDNSNVESKSKAKSRSQSQSQSQTHFKASSGTKTSRHLKVSTRAVKDQSDRKKSDRSDSAKRGENANDRRGVRKARVSKRR